MTTSDRRGLVPLLLLALALSVSGCMSLTPQLHPTDIEALEQNGITKVAFKRMGDPAVIPLWFGEGDTVISHLADGALAAFHKIFFPDSKEGSKMFLLLFIHIFFARFRLIRLKIP